MKRFGIGSPVMLALFIGTAAQAEAVIETVPVGRVTPEPGAAAAPGNDTCPATDEGTLSSAGGTITGDTTGMADDFGHSGATHGAGVCKFWGPSDAADTIHTFTVDQSGQWEFTTCPDPNTGLPTPWDTNLMVTEDLGAGCPGDVIAGCAGDDPDECGGDPDYGTDDYWTSTFSAYLCAGHTYYLIVDGYQEGHEGPYTVTYSKIGDVECTGATEVTDCGDGVWCNGAEFCVDDCYCSPGTPPDCSGSTPVCDEENDVCAACYDMPDPDGFCGDDSIRCNGRERCDDDSGACTVLDRCVHPNVTCAERPAPA